MTSGGAVAEEDPAARSPAAIATGQPSAEELSAAPTSAGVASPPTSRGGRARIAHWWLDGLWRPGSAWVLRHGDRVFPLIAAALIGVSLFLPFWSLKLHAPQYIDGLTATIWLDHVSGDVAEIDGLNHYIGMRPLDQAGEVERALAMFAVPAMALLTLAAALRRPWFWLFAVPGIAFPAVFVADLFYWLYDFGNNLDPTAALSSSIKPFTPTILGTGYVGQFRTTAMFAQGFWLAAASSVLLMLALVSRRWQGRQRP